MTFVVPQLSGVLLIAASWGMNTSGAVSTAPTSAEVVDQDCTPQTEPRWESPGSEEEPLVLIDSAKTGGNSNGPGCDGCTVWCEGIVFWGESGYAVIAFPNGAEVGGNVTLGQTQSFGGGTYQVACGEKATWDFVSPTSGGALSMACSECQ